MLIACKWHGQRLIAHSSGTWIELLLVQCENVHRKALHGPAISSRSLGSQSRATVQRATVLRCWLASLVDVPLCVCSHISVICFICIDSRSSANSSQRERPRSSPSTAASPVRTFPARCPVDSHSNLSCPFNSFQANSNWLAMAMTEQFADLLISSSVKQNCAWFLSNR